MQDFGKIIFTVGLIISLIGLLVLLLNKLGLPRIPGDLHFKGENWNVYIPIGTSIVISLLLTGIFWLIKFFSDK